MHRLFTHLVPRQPPSYYILWIFEEISQPVDFSAKNIAWMNSLFTDTVEVTDLVDEMLSFCVHPPHLPQVGGIRNPPMVLEYSKNHSKTIHSSHSGGQNIYNSDVYIHNVQNHLSQCCLNFAMRGASAVFCWITWQRRHEESQTTGIFLKGEQM